MSHSLNQSLSDLALVACPNCDLLQRLPELHTGETACCSRCQTVLWRHKKDSLNRTLALAIAAAFLWLIANTMPMLGLTAVGRKCFTTVFGGAELLWQHGMHVVAAVVFFTAVLAPGLQILVMLAVLLGVRCERPPFWVGTFLKHLPFTQLWSMMEVMLLGVLVSLTKIAEYATVIPGHALFAVGALIVVLAALQSSFDAREVWLRVQWVRDRESHPASTAQPAEVSS